MCYLLKKYFWWLLRRVKNLWSTACKHYRKCNVIYRYFHIELIWCLLTVQYLENNVIMVIIKRTTRFIRFTDWIPLKYGLTTTPPVITHCQKTLMSSLVFHIAIPKTSNIRRPPSIDLLTDEFSKRVYYKTRLILENWRYSLPDPEWSLGYLWLAVICIYACFQGLLWCAAIHHGERCQGLWGGRVWQAAWTASQVHEVRGWPHDPQWRAMQRIRQLRCTPRTAETRSVDLLVHVRDHPMLSIPSDL